MDARQTPRQSSPHALPPAEAGPPDGAEAGPPVRRLPIFSTVATALLMMSLDTTIVATALKALQEGLDTSINWASWTLTAYSFGFVLMLPISGKLSDRFGRKRVFLWSMSVFTLSSLLCGLVNNIYLLIALRAVQAAGGAGFTPSATGIIVDHFGDARDRAVGLFGSIFPLGGMIGPIFGGLFVTWWSWRAIFFVNVPAGLLVLLFAWRLIPPDRTPPEQGHTSLGAPGMALMGGAVLSFMLAASYLGERNAVLYSPLLLLPAALLPLFLWGFLRHTRHTRTPFIQPRLIWGAGFGPVNYVNGLFGGITLGAVALVPLYAGSRYGLPVLQSGTLLIAEGIAASAASTVMAFLLRYTGYRRPILGGIAGIALGFLLLALPPMAGLSPYLWLSLGAFVVGLSFGIINPATRNAGLQLAPDHAATLAALRSMFLQIGSIATISIATAVFAASGENAHALALAFAGAALVLAVFLPTARRVPEHLGAW